MPASHSLSLTSTHIRGILCNRMHISSDSCSLMADRYQTASDLFHVLSHPVRLQILDELRRGSACVCHLEAVLDRPQAYVSQQLRVLREGGIVSDRRDGLFVYYHMVDERVERLVEQALGPVRGRREPSDCACPHCTAGANR